MGEVRGDGFSLFLVGIDGTYLTRLDYIRVWGIGFCTLWSSLDSPITTSSEDDSDEEGSDNEELGKYYWHEVWLDGIILAYSFGI